ncbi:hypothetical protein B0T10DRAFT_523821 [Thelonectria olida]|uniref:Uncharacterized protein n=1 Tax=Thelonectria olida TaxID=1576542 RepID=A0A9P8VPC2_9HYPO|nr:hypothetical protein B0T10DRAFT_523821 [Thelonectria olida]
MLSSAFFEVSWSILSTICMANVLFGFLVCGITSFSLLASVPIVTSAAGAVANGLCFYTYYTSYPRSKRAATSVLGDIFWLVQEAGLLMYSYIILRHVLYGTRRYVFIWLFWFLMIAIVVVRCFIILFRARYILHDDMTKRVIVDDLHIGYFGFMAVLECLSAYFLIARLTSVKKTSLQAGLGVGIFRSLTRSTEVRVAILAVQGILRTITHSLQVPGQQATNLANQLDRFMYALLCLFPVVLYIDLLASKLVYADHVQMTSSLSRPGPNRHPKPYVLHQENSLDAMRSEHRNCTDTLRPCKTRSPAHIEEPEPSHGVSDFYLSDS